MYHRFSTGAVAALALCTALACSDSVRPEPEPEPGSPGFTVTPASFVDTISVMQPISVTLNDRDGEPVAGAHVSLEAISESGAILDFGFGQAETAGRTDQAGQFTTTARFGTRAGSGLLVVEATGTEFRTEVPYTVKAGRSVEFRVSPEDTAVHVGDRYQIGLFDVDRLGNATESTHQLQAQSFEGSVEVSPGGSVKGVSLGRAHIQLTHTGPQPKIMTLAVSVVPEGRVVAYAYPRQAHETLAHLVSFDTDGGNFRVLHSAPGPDQFYGSYERGMHPVVRPDAGAVAFVQDGKLFSIDPATGERTLLLEGGLPVDSASSPEFTADGQWLYFTRRELHGLGQLWRIRGAGGGAEQVALEGGPWHASDPSPDPSGERVVFTQSFNLTPRLAIANPATGQVVQTDQGGWSPEWSPDGEWIAFISRRPGGGYALWRMRPDGTDSQLIGDGIHATDDFSWSSDSEWLLFTGSVPDVPDWVALYFVNVESGQVLPLLPNRPFLVHPSLR